MNRTLSVWIKSVLVVSIAATAHAQQPAPAPSDTAEIVHIVKDGDTLWDIAQAYLKDPFRWPEIFRRNTDVVENPHWIYPGERIRIASSEVRPDVLAARGPVEAAPIILRDDRTVFAQGMSGRRQGSLFGGVIGQTAVSAVKWGEIESAPYVDTLGGPRRAGRITSTVERTAVNIPLEDVRLQLNDHAYITLPSNRSAEIGDRFVSYKLGPEIGPGGQIVVPTGVFLVDSLRENGLIRARLVRQFNPVGLEQRLLSLDLVPRPSNEMAVPVATASTNKVIWVQNDPVLPSLQHYLVLDPAANPAISIGDIFTLVDAPGEDAAGRKVPPEDIGMIQIVRVTRYGATGIVIGQSQPVIRAGNLARRIGRMP